MYRSILWSNCDVVLPPVVSFVLDVHSFDRDGGMEMGIGEKGKSGDIRLSRESKEYWRVTFDIPPLNIFGPANIPQLEEIVRLLESDEDVKVVVFDSAVEGFFLR